MPETVTKVARVEDFLRDYALRGERAWLTTLIEAVIAARKIPSASTLNRVFADFMVANEFEAELRPRGKDLAPAAQSDGRDAGFALRSLKHVSGVNAIVDGAELQFHAKLTVIYGKNGSGKSGFVRVLKRLAGSRTQEEIWQNVRKAKTRNRCHVKVTYSHGGSDVSCDWRAESGVEPFGAMSVFDGKSVSVYLTKNLGFTYQPHGLELFQVLSGSLIELQDRLSAEIRKKEVERPFIRFCSDTTAAGKLLARVNAKTSAEELDKLGRWGAAEKAALGAYLAERNGLQNPDNHEELLRSRLTKVEALADILGQIQVDLSPSNLRLFAALAKQMASLKSKHKAVKGKTLEDYEIPEQESAEWQQFLDAGEDYVALSRDDRYPHAGDGCIYCLQKLSAPAQRLLQLYRELYKDEAVSDLEILEEKLNSAIEGLPDGKYRVALGYKQSEFNKILPDEFTKELFAVLSAADLLAKQSLELLQGKAQHELPPLKFGAIISIVAAAKAKATAELKVFRDSQRNLLKRSQELDRSIAELKDAQKLAENRAIVDRFIEIEQWIARAKGVDAQLGTRSITELGKKAWQALVSDAFRETFEAESRGLNAPAVTLAFRGEYGSQMRDKSVAGVDQIDQVLSEGEQKAVALADFFAEQSMRSIRTPIVLDDPATSFDHERKELIAERIVALSADRQVIVFTHDLMFASYLHEHVEAKGGLDAARAAFHDIRAEADRSGIVTDNYYPGATKFEEAMKKIETRVLQLASMSGADRSDGIRDAYGQLRRAVEKAVEERIFGRVIHRWSDQIQMHNVDRASLDRKKLEKAKELHEVFSRYITAHNQSDEMIQHAMPDLERLKLDIKTVKDLAVR
jgi:energy-coupling factor transporter ATP-binding protein EcfA2